MLHDRIVPLIIAVALFMENMDSTVIATSLPAIAADIGTNPLALKLAVTSYLLSLAEYSSRPAAGPRTVWGAHRVPRSHWSVRARIDRMRALQFAYRLRYRPHRARNGRRDDDPGRSHGGRPHDQQARTGRGDGMGDDAGVDRTSPGAARRRIYPTTYATWHWIFIINVPIGLLGIVLATRYIPDVRAEGHERFDVVRE